MASPFRLTDMFLPKILIFFALVFLLLLPSLPLAAFLGQHWLLTGQFLGALGLYYVFLGSVYLRPRFFVVLVGVILTFIIAFVWTPIFFFAQALLFLFGAAVLADLALLFQPNLKINCRRTLPKMFSLGEDNPVFLDLSNEGHLPLRFEVLEEVPDVFQLRNFRLSGRLGAKASLRLRYQLRPNSRGSYRFYRSLVFVRSLLGLVERRLSFEPEAQSAEVAVYPSIIQMKQMELMALSRISTLSGIKRLRRLGHSYEFEQIRNYVKGDDYRSINWKATSRRNSLMVNQYEDERSQQVFTVIDKSRSMKLPFRGLSLMDHAINTALVLANIALQKHDKAGLLTFSDKIGATLRAETGPKQLHLILEALYREAPRDFEANYELLFTACRKFINRRSLVFLFTNFESYDALSRVLPTLRKINNMHLLVVVFFENPELVDFAQSHASDTEGIYERSIAAQFNEEKQRVVQQLRQYGIQAILTRPENLSINAVNKYLELKARGLI